MAKFKYEGFLASGTTRHGEIEATSKEEAAAKLRELGLFAQNIWTDADIYKTVLPHKDAIEPTEQPMNKPAAAPAKPDPLLAQAAPKPPETEPATPEPVEPEPLGWADYMKFELEALKNVKDALASFPKALPKKERAAFEKRAEKTMDELFTMSMNRVVMYSVRSKVKVL